jgi:Fic family protein
MKYKQQLLNQMEALENLVAHISKQIEGNQITAADTVAALATLTTKLESTRDLLELED